MCNHILDNKGQSLNEIFKHEISSGCKDDTMNTGWKDYIQHKQLEAPPTPHPIGTHQPQDKELRNNHGIQTN